MTDLSHIPTFEADYEDRETLGALLVAAAAIGKVKFARVFGQTAHGEKLEADITILACVDGSGVDWAGKLVERLPGLSPAEYMRVNVWGALGMKHVSLSPSSLEIQSRSDRKVLSKELADELFRPQLSDKSKQELNSISKITEILGICTPAG
ncbi:hypothetical protein DL769_006408 [Monosporascus sp. CRB-8-3]|nr:hypothetical protein DL769_006408 [Monosporascus sp. CRB-8-3]